MYVFVPVLAPAYKPSLSRNSPVYLITTTKTLYICFYLSFPIWVDLSSLFTIAKIKQIPEIE